VNDCVLGVLALQKGGLRRVLYIDVDIHHGDGVEEAFRSSDRVLTLSIHKRAPGFFPGTGGTEQPLRETTVNVPLSEAMDDASYQRVFHASLETALASFHPDAIVLQCGVDGCNGDPIGDWKLTSRGYAACAAMVKRALPRYGSKLLVLGGGGYNPFNVARCWAAVTAALTSQSLPEMVPDGLVATFVPSGSIKTHTEPPLGEVVGVGALSASGSSSGSGTGSGQRVPCPGGKTSTRYYAGSALSIAQRDGEHIGSHLWPGAELLAKWIEQNYARGELTGTKAVELGAGVGLVALVAALRGATVVATDRNDNCELLVRNVESNRFCGEVSAQPLSWGEPLAGAGLEAGCDLVLGAEIIYDARLFPVLLATLEGLLQRPGSKALIAYKERGVEERDFFASLRASGYWASVGMEPLLGDAEYHLVTLVRGAAAQ